MKSKFPNCTFPQKRKFAFKIKKAFSILCFLMISVVVIGSFSCSTKIKSTQEITESTYNIEFVKAARVEGETKNEVSVVFLVTPKKKEDFPPILSMGLKYSIGEIDNETYVDLQKQKGPGRISTILFGKNVADKSPRVYSMIKDKVNIEAYEDLLFIVFNYSDVIEKNIIKMSMTYGLWEKRNTNKRFEKKYNFQIETVQL